MLVYAVYGFCIISIDTETGEALVTKPIPLTGMSVNYVTSATQGNAAHVIFGCSGSKQLMYACLDARTGVLMSDLRTLELPIAPASVTVERIIVSGTKLFFLAHKSNDLVAIFDTQTLSSVPPVVHNLPSRGSYVRASIMRRSGDCIYALAVETSSICVLRLSLEGRVLASYCAPLEGAAVPTDHVVLMHAADMALLWLRHTEESSNNQLVWVRLTDGKVLHIQRTHPTVTFVRVSHV